MKGRTYWPYKSETIVSEAREALDSMLDEVLTERQERAIQKAVAALDAVHELSAYDAQDRSRYFPVPDGE